MALAVPRYRLHALARALLLVFGLCMSAVAEPAPSEPPGSAGSSSDADKCDRGDDWSCFRLAAAYFSGQGVKKDKAKAAAFCAKAADLDARAVAVTTQECANARASECD